MTPKSQAPARNNRCPCGSGRKFKHCCLLREKSLDSAARFTQALAHEQRGEGVKAQALYVEILTADPDFSPALQALGIIQYRQGDRATGLKFLTRARELTPDDPEMLNTLGVMLTDEGQIPEAIVCLHRAVQLLPDYAFAHNSLGNALRAYGKLAEAEFCYRETLRLKPDFAAAIGNLSIVLKETGRVAEAAACMEQALNLDPSSSDLWNNLGSLKQQLRLPLEALACYERSIALDPNLAIARYNIGTVFFDLGDRESAAQHLAAALALNPSLAQAHLNLGNVRKDQGRLAEAMACYSRALLIKPDYHAAHSNLLFATAFMDDMQPAEIYDLHCGWARMQSSAATGATHTNTRDPHKRLKIAYVSPDFRTHACAFFLEPLLRAHHVTEVMVHAYAQVAEPDDVTRRLQAHVEVWRSTMGLSDSEMAALIREDGIDVLIDLAGHTANNRLRALALKPAPVQATYLGYPATTGLPAMDWRLTDAVTEPEGMSEQFYTERLYRLPNSLWCYQPFADMGEVSVLPALANGYVTFGSFNNFSKIGPRVVDLWARVLSAVPHSRLLMLTVPSGTTQNALLERFESVGIARERIELHDKLPRPNYNAMFARADIALDPFPCNGGTTTCDALWMGLPVVALIGERFLSRAAFSVLNAAGFGELGARDELAYVERCAALAADLPALAERRRAMRGRMSASPLMDAEQFASDIEAAYRAMWTAWCQAESNT